jgi:hypothetical protein
MHIIQLNADFLKIYFITLMIHINSLKVTQGTGSITVAALYATKK